MKDTPFSLDGKVTVVTSHGPRWLGDLVVALSEVGATIVLAGPAEEAMSAASSSVRPGRCEPVVIAADLTREPDVERIGRQALTDFGTVDVLINALTVEFWKPALETKGEEWRRALDVNLTSNFLCSREIGRHMVEQRRGSIVNVVSGLAQRGVSNGTAYCAGMGGVLQLTRALALEWASQKVRVNAVGVGWTEESVKSEGKDLVAGYIPMRRRAAPGDVMPLIIFLASDASSYVSGTVSMVDGGLMARA